MTLTPEEEKKIEEGAEEVKARHQAEEEQQRAEERGTTAKDFKEMKEKNKDKKPYEPVEPLGANRNSVERVLIGAGQAAAGVAGAMSVGAQKVQKGTAQYEYDKAHPNEGKPKPSPMMGRGLDNMMPEFGAPKRTSAIIYGNHYGNFGFSAGNPPTFGGIAGQRTSPVNFGFNRVSPVNFGFQRMSLPSFGNQSGARPPQYGGGMGFGLGFGLPRAAGSGTSNNPIFGKFELPLGKISKERDKNGNTKISHLELIGSGKLNIFGRRVR